MRILLGYSYSQTGTDIKKQINEWLSRVSIAAGIKVDSFCLTLDPPGPRLSWKELDALWERGAKKLLRSYENLARTLQDYEVFINWNGINLHPDFVRQLSTFNVFGCFDDPESSEELSKPVATAYDLCLVGNIAEIETYKKWGVKEVRFWPLGFFADMYNPGLRKEQILNGERDIDIALVCERVNVLRRERLDKFVAAFPEGKYYGKGWPNGFLPLNGVLSLYQRTKIGPNFHNSTGPINFRTYTLPANGIMQICDNKSHLGEIFELGKEVIGFDTVEECIELCRYYLAHNEERRKIAVLGWERAVRDYNEIAVFKCAIKYIEEVRKAKKDALKDQAVKINLRSYRIKTFHKRVICFLKKVFYFGLRLTGFSIK